jgi:hypothetical protein
MREECKHFQSRTYASGEAARFCALDLAPEAPWRCPEGCTSFQRRLADVAWEHGTLIEQAIEDEPEGQGEEISALLDAAENIVNAVVPEARAEAQRANDRRGRGWFRRGRGG